MAYKDPEAKRAYQRVYLRLYRRKHPEKMAAQRRAYRAAHRAELNSKGLVKARVRRSTLRNEVLALFGSRCARCPFDDVRALQIDHVSAGGRSDRGSFPSFHHYLLHVRDHAQSGKYQVLCANCNWIKRVENGEDRPKKTYTTVRGADNDD